MRGRKATARRSPSRRWWPGSSASALTRSCGGPSGPAARNRFWAGLAGVFLVLAVAATASTVYAYQKVLESDQRLDQAIEIAYGFVNEAASMSDRFGVPAAVTLSLLGAPSLRSMV